MPNEKLFQVAILDDYQGVALSSADWSPLFQKAEITVFQDHLSDAEAVLERLKPFDVLCVMRWCHRITAPAQRVGLGVCRPG